MAAAPAGMGDWLDYSLLNTAVSVNLATGSASNVNNGAAGSVTRIQNVHGSNGGNTLTGDAQGNILVGGTGANTIMGGSGRSLLIGDKGTANIVGGSGGSASGGDILIGGYTIYDGASNANFKALMAILAEWQSTDAYNVRFTDIDTGAIAGGYKLNDGTTVFSDSAKDTLTAATLGTSTPAVDWFFVSSTDTFLGTFENGEHVNNR